MLVPSGFCYRKSLQRLQVALVPRRGQLGPNCLSHRALQGTRDNGRRREECFAQAVAHVPALLAMAREAATRRKGSVAA